ncbi:hypothetical protein [Kitasatospora sp. NPDC017646]|uniref:hypothetical protein n=1 Tax=Kitasatospora sp. NPDC017646 TaxID=3364024 RepID=UPI0037893C40
MPHVRAAARAPRAAHAVRAEPTHMPCADGTTALTRAERRGSQDVVAALRRAEERTPGA